MGSLNDIVFEGRRIGDMQRDELVLVVAALYQQLGELAIATGPKPIERNQLVLPAQAPGEDSTLERIDDADDQVESIGPPVVFPKYTPPRDKRVQPILKAAEKQRAAEAERATTKPREIFIDPRLDPNYRPPKPAK